MKTITYTLSSQVSTVIGKISMGMSISAEDKIADQLAMNAGFEITERKPTHKWDIEKNEWVAIKNKVKEE